MLGSRATARVEIVGTADADRVDVKRQGKKLVVKADFLEGGEVVYDAASVTSVEVDLAGGKNQLKVTGSVNVPVTDATAGQSEREEVDRPADPAGLQPQAARDVPEPAVAVTPSPRTHRRGCGPRTPGRTGNDATS